MGSLASTSFQLGRQAMAFTHGNSTFNGNNISIVDNPVHNGIVNRAKKYRVKDIKIYSYCLGWENLCEHECVDAITTLLPIVVAVCVGVTKLARAKGAKDAQRVEQKEMRWFT